MAFNIIERTGQFFTVLNTNVEIGDFVHTIYDLAFYNDSLYVVYAAGSLIKVAEFDYNTNYYIDTFLSTYIEDNLTTNYSINSIKCDVKDNYIVIGIGCTSSANATKMKVITFDLIRKVFKEDFLSLTEGLTNGTVETVEVAAIATVDEYIAIAYKKSAYATYTQAIQIDINSNPFIVYTSLFTTTQTEQVKFCRFSNKITMAYEDYSNSGIGSYKRISAGGSTTSSGTFVDATSHSFATRSGSTFDVVNVINSALSTEKTYYFYICTPFTGNSTEPNSDLRTSLYLTIDSADNTYPFYLADIPGSLGYLKVFNVYKYKNQYEPTNDFFVFFQEGNKLKLRTYYSNTFVNENQEVRNPYVFHTDVLKNDSANNTIEFPRFTNMEYFSYYNDSFLFFYKEKEDAADSYKLNLLYTRPKNTDFFRWTANLTAAYTAIYSAEANFLMQAPSTSQISLNSFYYDVFNRNLFYSQPINDIYYADTVTKINVFAQDEEYNPVQT